MKKQVSNLDKLTLANDFLFKHVMLRKRICKHILEELLHTKIADITYLEAEQTLDVYPDSHGIRLDVRIADDTNTHYNLEMQVKNPVSRTGKFNFPSALATTRPCWIQMCCKRDKIMTSFLPLISSSSACLTSLRIPSVFILLKDVAWKTWRLN